MAAAGDVLLALASGGLKGYSERKRENELLSLQQKVTEQDRLLKTTEDMQNALFKFSSLVTPETLLMAYQQLPDLVKRGQGGQAFGLLQPQAETLEKRTQRVSEEQFGKTFGLAEKTYGLKEKETGLEERKLGLAEQELGLKRKREERLSQPRKLNNRELQEAIDDTRLRLQSLEQDPLASLNNPDVQDQIKLLQMNLDELMGIQKERITGKKESPKKQPRRMSNDELTVRSRISDFEGAFNAGQIDTNTYKLKIKELWQQLGSTEEARQLIKQATGLQ